MKRVRRPRWALGIQRAGKVFIIQVTHKLVINWSYICITYNNLLLKNTTHKQTNKTYFGPALGAAAWSQPQSLCFYLWMMVVVGRKPLASFHLPKWTPSSWSLLCLQLCAQGQPHQVWSASLRHRIRINPMICNVSWGNQTSTLLLSKPAKLRTALTKTPPFDNQRVQVSGKPSILTGEHILPWKSAYELAMAEDLLPRTNPGSCSLHQAGMRLFCIGPGVLALSSSSGSLPPFRRTRCNVLLLLTTFEGRGSWGKIYLFLLLYVKMIGLYLYCFFFLKPF